ncbi:MAG: sigma-70 family RNA polymerase sigma factor [Coriobacteriales bacterium]|nr:sigma-70 family RNA polymerase sigma factor [Coriobacteriales bacterium]
MPLGSHALRKEDLGSFFDEYYPRLYNYIYYKTLDHAVAEDIVGDVMVRVAKSYASFDPRKGSLDDWAFRIARNLLFSYFRRRRDTVSIDAVGDAAGAVTIEDEVSDPLDERGTLVREALALLTEEEREIVFLRFWGELSNKDVAKRLGMNASTVSTKLSRAIAKIRKAFPNIEFA